MRIKIARQQSIVYKTPVLFDAMIRFPLLQFSIFFGCRFCGVKTTPVGITGIGAARLYLDDSEGGDADHLDASVLRHRNIGAVLELKGSHFIWTSDWISVRIS